MKKKTIFTLIICIAIILFVAYSRALPYEIGEQLDSFNGVNVYYNGIRISVGHGRNLGHDGYNLGQKWQCVEYVKRYYYEYFKHKMPNTYGHARDFFDPNIADGALNADRGLIQFTNPSAEAPQVNDVIVMSGNYGHMGIVTKTTADSIEMIQQNVGAVTRATFALIEEDGKWKIDNSRVSGWLRMNLED